MAVDDFHGGHTAAATAVAGDAGVGFDAHDDLPEVGAPAAEQLAVVGVDGLYVGDFHGEVVYMGMCRGYDPNISSIFRLNPASVGEVSVSPSPNVSTTS